MSALSDELRHMADILEAGDKPHWAALMRCAAAQLIAGDEETALLLEENKRLEFDVLTLREACAKVCEDIQAKTTKWGPMAGYCAEKIRERGNK
jgi:hypothetical protein